VITTHSAGEATDWHRALLATVRLKYCGGDGHEYQAPFDRICIGESVVEGRMPTYDPEMK
jgi:hypothetical protein